MTRIRTIYAVYKGDKFIAEGTIKQLASILKTQERYIYYLTTPSNKRRIEKVKKKNSYGMIAFKIGKERIKE